MTTRRELIVGLAGLGAAGCAPQLVDSAELAKLRSAAAANADAEKATEAEKVAAAGAGLQFVDRGGVQVATVIDRATGVDLPRGQFASRSDVAPHIFAEPGGLLVGGDFGYTGPLNPFGQNGQGWEAMYRSGGSINTFNPVTQEVLRWEGAAYQNVPEGGFGLFSAGQMTVELAHPDGAKVFRMPHKPGHNYLFAVRGFYPDGKQDSDRNTTAKITEYKPGHALVNMYQSRYGTNTGFISEGQFMQMVATSHTTGTNCGAEGCSNLTLVAFDLNTGALEIQEHRQERTANIQQAIAAAARNWNRVYSNYR